MPSKRSFEAVDYEQFYNKVSKKLIYKSKPVKKYFTGIERSASVSIMDTAKVRLPDFAEDQTDVWFWQVEAAFEAFNVTDDRKKYNIIIGQLPTRVVTNLADLRVSPPPVGQMYITLKDRISKEFADSTQTKITKLLGDLSLGDRKPSQLLAEMRAKASNTPVTEELLRQLWLRNLPEQVRAIISASDDVSLATASTMADRILESTKGSSVFIHNIQPQPEPNIMQSPPISVEMLQCQVNELTNMLKNMGNRIPRSTSRARTPIRRDFSGTRQQAASPRRYETCWWHFKFGAEARRCKQPCNYHKNATKVQHSGLPAPYLGN